VYWYTWCTSTGSLTRVKGKKIVPVRAPGIGITPLHMSQFKDTCGFVRMSLGCYVCIQCTHTYTCINTNIRLTMTRILSPTQLHVYIRIYVHKYTSSRYNLYSLCHPLPLSSDMTCMYPPPPSFLPSFAPSLLPPSQSHTHFLSRALSLSLSLARLPAGLISACVQSQPLHLRLF